MDVIAIQQALRTAKLDGWLFYDFRGSDPLSYSILGLNPQGHFTRRWYYFVPAKGEPTRIVHAIERGALDALPGRQLVYLPWQQLHEHLRDAISGAERVAMQYSPNNAIPYVSRVDAGTVEFIRSLGIDIVSSADLVAQFEATWTADQLATHHTAARAIDPLIDETFAEIGQRLRNNQNVNEFEIQQFMWRRYGELGLISDHPPIVAVNANSANPHYGPTAERNSPVRPGDWVLIDTWAKRNVPQSVFYDVTWTGFIGSEPPAEIQKVFGIVCQARDAAIQFVQQSIRERKPILGWQVDDAARGVIARAGHGEHFIHRTGHSIHTTTHGNGANMDNLETRDERRILPHSCFSIEPGIYLEGRFGVRSEVNIYVADDQAIVTGRPAQREIVLVKT